ncbi:MAG: cytochrome c [Candidatus Tectomicrobia bacterium]|uniref:Cytochrome c n=1 Tax=Tectimicrobiota bacterium TaxID=2528274 RepID=A0A932GLX5_UNCTE|nr:cytochrome c [Candidatus Tectomicrobia bacterium]
MSPKAARAIFYLGTLISLILFLALTVDTHRQVQTLTHADQLSDQVVSGKRVWQKYNCNDCHTILGFGAYYAPDMTKVYWRRGAEGIRAMVKNPELYTTWRKMPNQHVSDKEIDDLIAFFKWTSEIDNNNWPPQDAKLRATERKVVALGVSSGAVLFQEKGCFGCHKLFGTGVTVGPELTHVGGRLDHNTIEKILDNPRSVNPKATMPQIPLSHEQRDQLADFLTGLK